MRKFLLIAAACGSLCAQTKITPPRVDVLEYYGLRKITPARLQRVLATKEGDPFPQSKGEIEERLEKIPGVVRSHLEAVCCDEGRAILFVGIEEKGAPHFEFRDAPTGEVRLPGEIVETHRKFLAAVESAARAGNTAEDLRSGHSLMADPASREMQEQFILIAQRDLAVLRDVLRNSANDEHRAIAAEIIGYAPKKTDVVDDLQQAIQDPDDSVRNNAIRSFSAIAVLALQHPEMGIQISPTWFVEMLNSVVWSDRNKAVRALLNLTDSRPERILSLIRERGMQALAEMARWKSLRHALGPYMLLGRAGGLTDKQIEDSWTSGDREATIARVLKSSRK